MLSRSTYSLVIVLCYFQLTFGYLCCVNYYQQTFTAYEYIQPNPCQTVIPCWMTNGINSGPSLMKPRCPLQTDFDTTGGSGNTCTDKKSCSVEELCCLNIITNKTSCKLGVYYSDNVTEAPIPQPQCPKQADFNTTVGSGSVCSSTNPCSDTEFCCPDLNRMSYRCKEKIYYN